MGSGDDKLLKVLEREFPRIRFSRNKYSSGCNPENPKQLHDYLTLALYSYLSQDSYYAVKHHLCYSYSGLESEVLGELDVAAFRASRKGLIVDYYEVKTGFSNSSFKHALQQAATFYKVFGSKHNFYIVFSKPGKKPLQPPLVLHSVRVGPETAQRYAAMREQLRLHPLGSLERVEVLASLGRLREAVKMNALNVSNLERVFENN